MGRAKPIMIQGTMSNAGKSLLAAGLCRALSQDGLRVAPFKSQNMALNSGVTADGLEMGRAQIMQAEACGIAPDVRMNPILLKPESDHRSQLIVAGKAQGAFAARDYFARKKALMPQILEAFDSLAEENDVIVIEGAGSPVEINLAENDIVNMGLARAVSSPVLLAGDIDPGGVFAQLYGTVALLAPEDRALLRGLVVNKFRGDVEILRPGLAPLEKMCGVPVVGVVPYLKLDLDDEDSLAPRLSAREARGVIDVAVVRLPHLSNFTDFDPLSRVPGVGVRYVSSTTDLGRPDLVVLPGSKTTLDDARWLAASGIGACVRALSGAGTPVLGICGGYQLLGDELSDPHGREGVGTARGLGLIPASTVFKEEKHLAQSELRITGAQGAFSVWNGMTARGYEIHDGETTVSCAPAGTIGGKPEGAACGNVFGTYLHGLFDEPGVALASRARSRACAACPRASWVLRARCPRPITVRASSTAWPTPCAGRSTWSMSTALSRRAYDPRVSWRRQRQDHGGDGPRPSHARRGPPRRRRAVPERRRKRGGAPARRAFRRARVRGEGVGQVYLVHDVGRTCRDARAARWEPRFRARRARGRAGGAARARRGARRTFEGACRRGTRGPRARYVRARHRSGAHRARTFPQDRGQGRLHTEMRCEKHPYAQGICAREGVEY